MSRRRRNVRDAWIYAVSTNLKGAKITFASPDTDEKVVVHMDWVDYKFSLGKWKEVAEARLKMLAEERLELLDGFSIGDKP